MKNPWFRFYPEALTDRKIAAIGKLAGQPRVVVLGAWTTILSLANDSPVPGQLSVTETFHVTPDDVSKIFELPLETTQRLLDAFQTIELLTFKNGTYSVNKWNARQFVSDNVSERVKRFREKQERNVTETFQKRKRNGPETEAETETDITTGADAPERKLTDLQFAQSALEIQFSSLTGLDIPKRKTDSEKKEAASRWWNPLKVIWELAGKDLPRAENLMKQAMKQLTAQKLTYDSPASLVRTARSLCKKPIPELSSDRPLRGPHD